MLVDPSLQDWYLYLMVVLADKVTLVQKYKTQAKYRSFYEMRVKSTA